MTTNVVLHPFSVTLRPRFSEFPRCFTSSFPNRPLSLRYAVLGAGFAGISVAWHLLKESPKELRLSVDIYDEIGIGGGASGVSGGLLHPYSPKGKLLWHGAECWRESLELLNVTETAAASMEKKGDSSDSFRNFMVRRRGILRPATNAKTLGLMSDNARNCLASSVVETVDKDGAQTLVPNLCLPLNCTFYFPGAMNLNPQRYFQALFLACQNSEIASLGRKNITLVKKCIDDVLQLEGEYDAVVICLGSKVDFLPGLTGKLPLRTCRGVINHLKLHENARGSYPDSGPSILSDAWLAVQGPRNLHMGSTWEWQSRNYSSVFQQRKLQASSKGDCSLSRHRQVGVCGSKGGFESNATCHKPRVIAALGMCKSPRRWVLRILGICRTC